MNNKRYICKHYTVTFKQMARFSSKMSSFYALCCKYIFKYETFRVLVEITYILSLKSSGKSKEIIQHLFDIVWVEIDTKIK